MTGENEYRVEYAVSSRSKCSISKQKIPQGALRIGKMVQSQQFDGMIPQWYDFEVFKHSKKKLPEFQKTCGTLKGLNNLRWEDQEEIRELLGKKTWTVPKDKPDDELAEKEKQYRSLQEENEQYWEIRDNLQKHCKKADLSKMLSANDQDSTGGIDKLLDRCAFGMLFGALPHCPNNDCQKNYLYFSGNKFKCAGSTEWAKCQWSAPIEEVETKDWEIPKTKNAYLKNFKFEKRTKMPIPELEDKNEDDKDEKNDATSETSDKDNEKNENKETEKEDESKEENDQEKPTDMEVDNEKTKEKETEEKEDKEQTDSSPSSSSSKKIFNGLTICLSGRFTTTHEELKKLLESNGALFATSIYQGVDYLISTATDLKKRPQKIKQAKKLKIPIMKESFIHDSLEEGKIIPLEDIDPYVLYNKPKASTTSSKRTRSSIDVSKVKLYEDSSDEEEKENNDDNNDDDDEPPKKKRRTSDKVKVQIKGRSAVDPDFEDAEEYHVLEEGSDIYTVTLNMADVTRDINSYYKLQVLEHDTQPGDYILWRKWGRIGSSVGGNKAQEFGNKMAAKREFKKLYEKKTENEWENRHNFVKKPKRFYPVDVEYGNNQSKIDKLLEEKNNSEYKGVLSPAVRDLVSTIFDVKEMQKALLEMEIDTKKMPLGQLSKKRINQGFGVLNEILSLIDDGVTDDSKYLSLTNKFFTFIPHDYGESPPLIKDKETVKKKTELLETLSDMEIATSLLNQDEESESDPIDRYYKQLNTELTALDKDSELFKMLEKYVQNTHAPTHRQYTMEVEEIFTVNRESEYERYKSKKELGNRQLLWHGSRLTNYVGILSQGLRIAPPEAPATGYMFGKGVYFADMCSKSANYCRTSPDNPTGIMLLSEVALGNMYEIYHAQFMNKPPKGKHSTKGIGATQPDPKEDVYLEDNVKVPLGKPSQTPLDQRSSLLYNEYIVYDVSQINIKYLLKLRFNYKRSTWF